MNDQREHYEDRIMDLALREKLGEQKPSDLSERILCAAALPDRATIETTPAHGSWKSALAAYAVAASLLVAFLGAAAVIRMNRAEQLEGKQVAVLTNQLEEIGTIEDFQLQQMDPQQAPIVFDPSASLTIPELAGAPARDVASLDVSVVASVAIQNEAIRVQVKELSRLEKMPAQAQLNANNIDAGRVGQTILRADEGNGPGEGGDKYDRIVENDFLVVKDSPLSTFSIDVDTASYSKVRMYLMQHGVLPPAGAVRIEELVNYFTYDYAPPTDEHPFAARVEVAGCPWNAEHRLVRVGIKGKVVEQDKRPPSNLVFLLDVSGSMGAPNRLPLVKRGMTMLVEQLGENDRVAIVVYAGAAGMVLPSTPGNKQRTILDSLDSLHAGGSTNGGEGIRLAYQTALDHFIKGGVNRVILCTDGDFNVGTTSTDELVRLAEQNAKAGVFVSVLGFGMGNHNDSMMEQLSNKANGNYAFIDTLTEARKVLVEQMSGTLVTIAKDVKIQVEFNPSQVASYRLIGYENRILAARDFNDDKKDAGEIGAGHTVTALYEIIPAGDEKAASEIDELKYQKQPKLAKAAESGELLTVKLRYKQPDGDVSTLVEFPVTDSGARFAAASQDFQFAAAIASFGMLLRDSQFKGDSTFAAVAEIAASAKGADPHGYRAEFVDLVNQAKRISGR